MSTYHPVWPELEFGWRVVAGSLVGFMGGAMGSAGGVGGGGIFVPMLTLILGFDPKSSAAVSKCMIMGSSSAAVYYNLRATARDQVAPNLIDYDLALLIQPMLMLGISVGVVFNVIFPQWIITLLLVLLFIVTSTKAILKGIETWKKETSLMMMNQKAAQDKYCVNEEEAKHLHTEEESTKLLESETKPSSDEAVKNAKQVLYIGPPTSQQAGKVDDVLHNTRRWKELSILTLVWMAFFAVQIAKIYVSPCSFQYWILNSPQVPIAASATMYEARGLMRGEKAIASSGKCNNETSNTMSGVEIWIYCGCGMLAGAIVGLLGLGGGFILAPLFLHLGIPPQVASATSTFLMAFSSSMSVVQYYILKRFPVPYATYLACIAMMAGFTGQHVSRKLTALLGRASIIIFILAATILISSVCLGGAGISHIIQQLKNHEYMGFDKLCHQPQI